MLPVSHSQAPRTPARHSLHRQTLTVVRRLKRRCVDAVTDKASRFTGDADSRILILQEQLLYLHQTIKYCAQNEEDSDLGLSLRSMSKPAIYVEAYSLCRSYVEACVEAYSLCRSLQSM